MTRVKRGTTSLKHRRKILKQAKGYNFGRSTKERQAKEAVIHAGAHAFAHRRKKKGDFRRLWNVKINAAIRAHGVSYSKFIHALKEKNVVLNRKILADLAEHHPGTFEKILKETT
ncbi:50S ribosomal protein L20 [bacterium]|nr:50S ribosomal protein L20 [bacterium]|tara:strand:- start:470 stop:814 length:345 start_codon:yes stop_codon:yes gene_type:complete